MKGVFANRSALFQAGVLLYLFLLGFVVGTVICLGIENAFRFLSDQPTEGTSFQTLPLSFYRTHLLQLCSGILTFMLPALITAYLCSKTPGAFLGFRKVMDVRVFVLTALMLCFISPIIEITSFLNAKLSLPEWMAPLENWVRATEDIRNEVAESLLSQKGVLPFITNLCVIAAFTGVAEELMFRGALFSIVRKKISNPHVTIWLIAILFSAIHLQFYGFLPRTLLGAFLGYLLYWSQSIWIPIFAHALNNAVAVTVSYAQINNPYINGLDSTHENMKSADWITYFAFSLLSVLLFVVCARQMKKTCVTKQET